VKKVTITTSQEEEWDQLGGCANSLGDNFVVNALEDNDEGVDFLCCALYSTNTYSAHRFKMPVR